MKLPSRWLNAPAGYAFATALRGWMSTCRYEGRIDDPSVDPWLGVGGPRIYVVWHEYMLAPIYLRAGCEIAILLSRHRDADLLASVARHSGYECVRGSTYRGGSTALRKLVERGRRRNLVITPDGPRGPRRRMAAGPIFLASKLGVPIVPMGFAYDRERRLSSWDRFAVPRPFTTVRVRLGEEIRLPGELDRFRLEAARQRVERALDEVTESAEAWAAGGAPLPGATRLERRVRQTVSLALTPEPAAVLRRAA